MVNEKIKCIIIEDEAMATKLLTSYIDKMDELELVATYDSPVDFIAVQSGLDYDIIFLDIMMPEMTGMELLRTFPLHCEVIITSASPDFALDCYPLKVSDYLLKPFRLERFMDACQGAINRIRLKKQAVDKGEASPRIHMLVKVDKRLVKIKIADILYVEAAWEYAKIFTKGQTLMILTQIKSLEKELEESSFFRIHRSYLINMDHVDYIEGNMICINKTKLPVSRNYRTELLKRLNEML